MTFARHHLVSLAILRPVVVDIKAGTRNLATKSVTFSSRVENKCSYLLHCTLPAFEKTPKRLWVMSTAWEAAPHTDDCNFSVRGSH